MCSVGDDDIEDDVIVGDQPLKNIAEPHENDVLFGRGGTSCSRSMTVFPKVRCLTMCRVVLVTQVAPITTRATNAGVNW